MSVEMVSRNFSQLESAYSRMLQVSDDDREYLNLEELKPHHLTELSNQNRHTLQLNAIQTDTTSQTERAQTHSQQAEFIVGQSGQIHYDLNAQPNSDNGTCLIYLGEMTQMTNNVEPIIETISTMDKSPKDQKMHPPSHSPTFIGGSRKRKNYYTEGSDFDDETSDDSKSVRTTDDNKKQNHSEIEKRRRDKMNTYITELSSMVPLCNSMSRKLDKLTVLRMAVQHLKSIRGAVHSYTEGHYKPTFLSDQELKMLILQAAEGFLFVVGCDRGRILFVSESVSQVLNYSQGELLGQSWFDILHPKDVAKVKEQLSSSDLGVRERLIDAKTMLPVKTDEPHGLSRLCPGARRSFFCRMKSKAFTSVKEECPNGGVAAAASTGGPSTTTGLNNRRKSQNATDKKYCVIQCTGYLKSWAPAKMGLEEPEADGDVGDPCNMSCLVAIGRVPPDIFAARATTPRSSSYLNVASVQFMSRHAIDGKFLFVDQRATLVLGFLPQEMLGASMYEYYHNDDVSAMAESHKEALRTTFKVTTAPYRFRTKEKGFVRLQSEWKSFKNPWTKEIDFLTAKNSVIMNDLHETNSSAMNMNAFKVDGSPQEPNNFDFFNQNPGRDMNRIINTHLEASKIGAKIADQVFEMQRRVGDSSSDNSPLPSEGQAVHSNNPLLSSGDNSASCADLPGNRFISSPHHQLRVKNDYSSIGGGSSSYVNSPDDHGSDSEIARLMGNSTIPAAEVPNQVATSTADGNDEAAMAVIMSLLEADAGLGGPVDFTGLPWPLP